MITPVGSGKRFRSTRAVTLRHPLAYAIATVLAMAALPVHAGSNPPPLSQAWLQQQALNRNTTQPAGSTSPATAGIVPQSPQQLLQQQQVQQSLANLSRTVQAVAAQIAAQQSAQQAAQKQTSPVPNGLTPGGLVVASGISSNPSLWQNANLPTQTTSNGQTTVQVKQTAQKAILTWNSFNVGSNTTLYFNQSGGNQTNGSNNNWIALNRVIDPSGVPSQIFGQIKAEGTVYILNHNGILFGAGSQVNTQSLIASSLDLLSSDVATSNSEFLNGGIASTNSALPFLVNGAFSDGKNHDVVVQNGASITGGTQGFVLLAAPSVSNAGSVVDDQGQVILAAGTQFINASSSTQPLTVLDTGTGGNAINTGLLQSRRGHVEMDGYSVTQDGVALASTSINYPGSIVLNAQDEGVASGSYQRGGALTLGPNSVTAVLPEEDGATTTSTAAATAAFVSSSLTLTGKTVTFQPGSLLEAPNAKLSINAVLDNATDHTDPLAGRIYVDNSAVIDVSGLADVELPMSALLVTIPRIGQNELANSPLLRNSFLYTQKNVVVDSTQSGVTTDGLAWVGSPILNVSGYVDDVPRTVDQLMTNGGSINLTGTQVIVRSGAQLNLGGGYIAYQAGWVTTPNLLASNGRIYNIADADPNLTYVGFAGEYDVVDNRWGVTTNYSNPLLAGTTRWDSGFAVGGNAGTLNIATGDALVLDGQISAQAFAGRNQVTQSTQPSGGTLEITVAGAANTVGVNVSPSILLQQSVAPLEQLDPNFKADTPWSTVLSADDPTGSNTYDLSRWVPVSANLAQQGGFSTVNLTSTAPIGGEILEQAGTVLGVQPGGSIQLTADAIHILGELSAPSGAITLAGSGGGYLPDPTSLAGALLPGDIIIGNDTVLSTRGLWVNDTGASTDNYIGDRYINGGTIKLINNQADIVVNNAGTPTSTDETGSIVLQSGSLLDVSSGGYVNSSGQLQLNNGVPIGSGGSISLIDYADQGQNKFDNANWAPPSSLGQGKLVLDGTLRAYGFSGGGTLSLQVDDIQIGGSASDLALSNGLYLSPSFFAGQGFDNYALTSLADANIAPGAIVRISRDNLLPNVTALQAAPTGTDIYGQSSLTDSAYVSVGQLAPYLRYITRGANGPGFSLNAGQYLNYSATSILVNGFSIPAPPAYPGVTGSLTLGVGALISADAGANIALTGTQSTILDGTIDAPGGTITTPSNSLASGNFLTSVPELVLGPSAVLDVAGVSLVNPLAEAVSGSLTGLGVAPRYIPRTGVVLDGGSVSLTSDYGYVLTAQGSVIDVSGSSDVYDLPSANGASGGAGTSYTPTPVWSNAGSIVLGAAAGLYADGKLLGQAGNAQGEGGSLQIVGMKPFNNPWEPKSTAIVLQSSGLLVPGSSLQLDGGDPTHVTIVNPATGAVTYSRATGVLYFALDHLDDSGITSLVLGPDASVSSTINSADNYGILPIGFAGNINLSLGKSFAAYASTLTALPAGSKDLSGVSASAYNTGDGIVQISAPYVEITGASGNTTAQRSPVAGSGTLDIQADFMDLGGLINLQGWGNTHFAAGDAIRFYEPVDLEYANANGSMIPGMLFSTGNITLKAAELYPVSNYYFAIDANPSGLTSAQGQALTTTLTIQGNGAASVPLSAGGGLLLDADTIVQDGTVWVPSGNLVIGVQNPSTAMTAFGLAGTNVLYPNLVATQTVTLGAGSLTSVSLGGETVPYGSTTDGQEWNYAGAGGSYTVSPLTAPPAKSITIAGSNVSLDSGATIDIRGGGSLQASEWVPGTGGTVNVLTQYETSYANSTTGEQVPQYTDGRAIYAILPGYTAPVSAQDAAMSNAAGAGAGPAVGQSIYLSGIAGLPAGYYTLLPAGYATLPGAYRVVQDTSTQNVALGQNVVLPDGTLSVTGYFANALDGAHQSTNTTFLVQSAPVWQQYSQYRFTDANSYFTAQAASSGTVAPLLPEDGGHLTLSATQQLLVDATLDNAPASGGRPGLVDIAAQAIQVVDANSTPLAGYLQISADQLTAFDAGSLLLGGTRQLTNNGYQVTSIADSVVLSNDSADPLQGQEILLVANGNGDPGAQGVVLQPGSYLAATGSSTPNTTPLLFGSNASSNGSAAVSGNGALLRVSQDGVAPVTRYDVSGTTLGNLTIDAGATVQGGGSLTMDTTGATSVDPNAVFTAQNIQATANQINFIGAGMATGAGTGGLVIGPSTLNLFNNAQQITLNSRGAIDFLGNVSIDLPQALNLNANAYVSNGGTVSIKAGTLGLGNAAGTSAATAAAGTGQLILNANELDFTAGNSVTQGFASITGNASQGMRGEGTGGMDFGEANVSFNTPILLAESSGDTALTTTGSFAVNHAGGTPLADDNLGGALALSGGTLIVGSQVDALAGKLNLTATSGDLTLTGNANVDTAGVNKTFYDVTTYAAGGNLALTSNQGSVIVNSGAVVNFAGAPLGGTAGSLTIAANNLATLNGTFEGGAASGYQGGDFTLSSGGALNLDQLAQLIRNAGITGGVAITSDAGNLLLSAGQSLSAQDVYLTANGGSGTVNGSAGVVDIEGTLNVSGDAAGEIQLFGRNGVTVNGSLLATSSMPGQYGGIVEIGTKGTPDGSLNATYGYENMQPGSAGSIVFGPNAMVNVSGGSAGVGGVVNLRAPLLANGDVPISFATTAPITGASRITLVPYAVWSTADAQYKGTAKSFDGLIDPAGWYTAGAGGTPQLVGGTWYDEAGDPLAAPTTAAMLQTYLSNDYFVPTSANAAHQDFYGYVGGNTGDPGTLMSYVEQPGYTFGNRYAGIANLQISPGIELINPDASTNGGDISILTNWNLGAGVTAADGTIQLAYRYGANPSVSASGIAPTLTVLALHNVNVDASITDGFYQQNDGASLTAPVFQTLSSEDPLYSPDYQAYLNAVGYLLNGNSEYTSQCCTSPSGGQYDLWNGGYTYFYASDDATGPSVATNIVNDTNSNFYFAVKEPQQFQSHAYYLNYQAYIDTVGYGQPGSWSYAFNQADFNVFLYYIPPGVAPPQIGASYAAYVQAYENYLTTNFQGNVPETQMQSPPPILAPLQSEALSNYTLYSQDYAQYITGFNTYYNYVVNNLNGITPSGTSWVLFYAPSYPFTQSLQIPRAANNSPSNMPSLANPASLASATLLGGSSSTYQLVAGANFASANPLSVVANTSAGNINLDGHFAAQYTANGGDDKTLEFPTVVRTGTGSIDIAAAGDIDWQDSTAPATVYAAGEPALGTTAGTGVNVVMAASGSGPVPDLLVTDPVNPVNAGNVLLSAGGNINSIEQVYDTTGSITGTAGTLISQFWWPWMETGNVFNASGSVVTRSSINFANFDQGVMSAGGNVAVTAGDNISDLSISLPTTWYANAAGTAITTVGGGNLTVSAGGNILSGSYFVAKGTGSLSAGGLIGSDFTYVLPAGSTGPNNEAIDGSITPVSTLLALQDAQWNVQARDGVNIADILDPSYDSVLGVSQADAQSYSSNSAVNVKTAAGDVTLGSLTWETQVLGDAPAGELGVLPSTLDFTALNGNVNILTGGGLYPSATGNLSLLAGGSIQFGQQNYDLFTTNGAWYGFGLIDANASVLPSPLSPNGSDPVDHSNLSGQVYLDDGGVNPLYAQVLHQAGLHSDDTTPVRIYALNGSIINGTPAPNGTYANALLIEPDKPALIQAGQDIVDLSFVGQQTHGSDVTRIVAGHDIYDTQYNPTSLDLIQPLGLNYQLVPVIELGGVGTLDVEAGHNVGPLTSHADLLNANNNGINVPTGIESIGNSLNPYLPHDGASVDVLFGVAPGIDTSNFLTQYLSNPNGVDGFGSLVPDLVTFMEQQEDGQAVFTGFAKDQLNVVLTPQQAETAFQQLPSYKQELFVQQEFFKLLAQVGADYNNPSSPYYNQYARGYAAIESLFPASLGYTDNGSGAGGINGEAKTVDTGDLDIRSSTIQTQQGGNISILGPGGQALIGSAEAPPVITNSRGNVVAGPNSMGVITLEQGNVDIFTDRSLLLAQSRVFTEQGGNMVIWSSNGDINAGQGAKTVAVIPPPSYLCDQDAFCILDAKGEVSGAGIATLQTIPGAPTGNVYLVAPRGTVDAGDAGIRVSGNLVVAAAQVLNADNIQVQGQKIGVPVAQTVNVGALTNAAAAAGAVSKVAQDMAKQQQNDALGKQPSIISVQVLGFGDNSTSIQGSGSYYDPNSPVQVLGAGPLSDARKKSLTEAERRQLSE
ncbi:filamentous haemagglutinin family protein [Dyella nitratireducens]|uniref:filamentous haemagglutinin family protein n=1 Tax=Dyella nitratireducens TaxID=1849580 RepID=UPI001667B2EA|nr:filamentous haemagglutinin family protein [Dyella nitratireducens]